jgi:hypothetical protein
MSGKLNLSEIDQAKVAGLNFTANALIKVGVDRSRLAAGAFGYLFPPRQH